jgi:hypothetical protein
LESQIIGCTHSEILCQYDQADAALMKKAREDDVSDHVLNRIDVYGLFRAAAVLLPLPWIISHIQSCHVFHRQLRVL